MKNIRIASRYSKALLSLAEENQIIEQAYESMKIVADVFKNNKELKVILNTPIVRETKKIKIIEEVFKGKINDLILKYLVIITKKKRSVLIEPIALEYQRLHKDKLNIQTVIVTTASGIDKEIENKVLQVAKKITNKNIEFQNEIDPSIIGGFILKIGDYLYDASVKRSLKNMKEQLYHSVG